PAVLKPGSRPREPWREVLGDAKALTIGTAEALGALWPALCRLGLPAILQTEIAGGEDRMESYHAFFGRDGQIVAEFTGRKIRTFPIAYGDSAALVTTRAEDGKMEGRHT